MTIVNDATLYLVMQHGWDLLPDGQWGVGFCLAMFGEPVSRGPVQPFITNGVENRRGIECWGCVSC